MKIKIGMKIRIIIKAMREPYNVRTTASWPLPCLRSSWPGRTERNESSSGAPRNIEGIKSRKECVTAIATMKITNERGEVICRREGEAERRKIAIRLT